MKLEHNTAAALWHGVGTCTVHETVNIVKTSKFMCIQKFHVFRASYFGNILHQRQKEPATDTTAITSLE